MSVALINPARATIPMQGRHLRWLNDGRAFLEHVDDLAQIAVAAVCVRCVSPDGLSAPRVTVEAEPHRAHVRCGCRAGHVSLDDPLEMGKLLPALQWALVCTACGEPIRGDNDPVGTRFTVECPCTTREYRLAVA